MIEPTPQPTPTALSLTIAGEAFILLPQRAAIHRASATLLIADVHLGKTTTFARSGVPIQASITRQIIERDLARITTLVRDWNIQHVVFAGDLFHARSGCDDLTMSLLSTWRHNLLDQHRALIPVTLVRGNHDRASGDPPSHMAITCLGNDATLHNLPLRLRHEPLPTSQLDAGSSSPQGPIIAGHLHPVTQLASTARQRARCACFWIQSGTQLILPAFGTFTGGHLVDLAPTDQLCCIIDEGAGHVIDITPLAQHAKRSSINTPPPRRR